MNGMLRRTLQIVIPAAALLLAGCGKTTIKSDLVLDGYDRARLDLHQKTESIELHNDSDVPVRVKVLDKKERVVSNMLLDGHEQVRLDIMPASAIQFDNETQRQAIVRWTLLNNKAIEYSMAMNP